MASLFFLLFVHLCSIQARYEAVMRKTMEKSQRARPKSIRWSWGGPLTTSTSHNSGKQPTNTDNHLHFSFAYLKPQYNADAFTDLIFLFQFLGLFNIFYDGALHQSKIVFSYFKSSKYFPSSHNLKSHDLVLTLMNPLSVNFCFRHRIICKLSFN